ncbi:ABC transporter permease [Embleya sp. NPDC001921]
MRSTTLRWLIRRVLLAVLVLLGAATLAFGAMHMTPGDPVRVMLGGTTPTPEAVAQIRADMDLDRPLIQQYGNFLNRLLHGDLGTSYQLNDSVSDIIGSQLWPTVQLALAGFLIAIVIALLLAVATAGRRPALRRLSSGIELILTSSPSFWVGVLLLTVFSFHLRLFPATGGTSLRGLVLPAVTLSLSMVGVFTQVLREGLERALEEPFVTSSRARGTGETTVRLRHALRHAMVAMITLSGWVVGALLGGAVVVESVFSRQGIGRTLATAISSRDLNVVTGIVVVSALLFTVINLAVDWLYRVVDPRLKEASW